MGRQRALCQRPRVPNTNKSSLSHMGVGVLAVVVGAGLLSGFIFKSGYPCWFCQGKSVEVPTDELPQIQAKEKKKMKVDTARPELRGRSPTPTASVRADVTTL